MWTRTTVPSLIRNSESTREYITISKRSQQNHLSNYIDLWYNDQKLIGLSGLTVNNYLQKIKALLEKHATPNEFDIKKFLIKRQECGSSSGTIANCVKAFRSFFGYLFSKGLYDLDLRCLKLPKVHYKERRVPRDDEVEKLFQVTENDDDRLSLLLLVDCGIRVTELASIKLKNIDLSNASILINGKGSKDRTVYLSETTIKYLRQYLLNKKGEYLFPVIRADAQIKHHSRRYFGDRLTKLCVKASVDHITPHQLRHYFATHTLSNGADIKAVSQILGHADVGITLKIYHHVNAKSIREMHREFSPLGYIDI